MLNLTKRMIKKEQIERLKDQLNRMNKENSKLEEKLQNMTTSFQSELQHVSTQLLRLETVRYLHLLKSIISLSSSLCRQLKQPILFPIPWL